MKKTHIAIDLGTTNTVVAHWNDEIESPEIIHIDTICRGTPKSKDIDDSYTIPSSLYLLCPDEHLSFPFSFFFRNIKGKTGALLGMQAIERDGGSYKNYFVNNFKSYLGRNSYQVIGKLGKWSYTAEEITKIFLKSLVKELKNVAKLKPTHATFCVPVDFYEFYRAKLGRIASHLKISLRSPSYFVKIH